MRYYIGVDLGTSAVKLLLMDEKGKTVKIVSKEYPLYMNEEGWSEQNPADWWKGVCEGLKEIASSCDSSCIKAVSFSGQMHGLVILDENDTVLRPAILWNDQRTQKQCDEINGGDSTFVISNTGNIALTGFTAPKLLWVKENEPELFAKIKKIMLPKDYMAYMLSGVHATDYSDAAGMLLLDTEHRVWSKEMLDFIGIKESQMAKLFNSFDVIGIIRKEAAKYLGLSEDTKIVIGGGDQAVGAVGSGTVENNMCSVALGTSGVVFIASDTYKADYGGNVLHSFCHANGKYHLMGVMLSAAGSNKWWTENILQTRDYNEEQREIKDLGKNKVYFLPYLTGERTPHNDPYARGAFVGMSAVTTRAEMTQAVLEGVAFGLRDTLEVVRGLGIEVGRVRINGGGAKSPLWRKIVANIFDCAVETINSEEGPAFGAAILASVGDGVFSSVEEACRAFIQVVDVVEPDRETVCLYNEKYPIFKKLYCDLRDTFRMLNQG